MSKRILFIDDEVNRFTLRYTIKYLEEEGYEVISAETVSRALQYLDRIIDLIILDIMMPEDGDIKTNDEGLSTGIEVLKRIMEKQPDIPVIMLTARNEVEVRKNALELGAKEYIVKPAHPEEIVRVIKKYI